MDWHIGGHLGYGSDDTEYEGCQDAVPGEDESRTTFRKDLA